MATRYLWPYDSHLLVYAWNGMSVDARELNRMDDDGGRSWPQKTVESEQPTPGVTHGYWGEHDFSVWRVYSCERCGWYVWHPIGFCHECGGRMQIIKGRSEDLQKHMNRNNYKDGGF